jgi:hypothetical protein
VRHRDGVGRAEPDDGTFGTEDLLPVPEHADRQQQRRNGAHADGDIDKRQAAGDDSGDEQSDRCGNEESAEPDHVRSPRAVRVTGQVVPCCCRAAYCLAAVVR